MHTEQEILQRRLAQFLTGDVFKTITSDDILSVKDGVWHHKGAPITQGHAEMLRKEARTLQQTTLYPLLLAELRYHANQKLGEAVTEADIICAKLLAYFVDAIESKVQKMQDL